MKRTSSFLTCPWFPPAPCVPRLTDVEIDCLVNSSWVIYEGSAGAEEYIVMATDGQGDIQTFECNSTSDGTCPLPPLMCSQNLTFTMTARNWQCPSAPSNAVTMETGIFQIKCYYMHA